MQLRPWIVVQDESPVIKQTKPFLTAQQDGFQSVMTLPARVPVNEQVKYCFPNFVLFFNQIINKCFI
jgi:hypothetical protein